MIIEYYADWETRDCFASLAMTVIARSGATKQSIFGGGKND